MTRTGRDGAALIITLAFIVLLSAILLIYFTQAINYRLLSNGSFNDFKSGAIGQSALETVTGDLMQEIANGSTYTTYGSGTNTSYTYIPTTNLDVVPMRSPRTYNGTNDAFPNLIRWSQRSDPISYPAVGSRASAVSSTNAALNGQYISPDRWNKHYLLPLASPNGTAISTTPTNAFIAPDWVYVTDHGPNVLTSAMLATGTNTVVGRYAYAVYDEGGLLDINVAGYPDQGVGTPIPVSATHPGTAPAGLPLWGTGYKGSEAFADLTQIGLSQTNVDQIVGWRNNYSAQPSGTFSSGYTFATTSAALYHDYVATNTTGFLTNAFVGNPPTTATDQQFISRQALIKFFIAEGFPQSALQYLATFTRDVEQPVYTPNPGRPVVESKSSMNAAPFGTGNDAYHNDRYGQTGQPTGGPAQDINPPFPSVRVLTSFTRTNGDGAFAPVGDPLVKERFPLSRLSLFPINEGTPSTANANLIYQYFGLTQSSAGLWTYNHDSSNTTGIDRLYTVASLGREPDFFELLKASINVGSVGKAACYQGNSSSTYWTAANSAAYLQQQRDILSQLQILQIGANIIDQAKADDYPTRIQFLGLPAYQVCGVEDLPYIYRVRTWIMRYGSTGSLGAILFQPELWNPHTLQSSALVANTAMPTSFRVRIAPDPTCGSTPVTPIGVTYATSPYSDITASVTFNSGVTDAPLTFNAGEANGYCGFREPTLLAHVGKPAKPYPSNLATTDATYTDYPAYTPDPTRVMTGFKVATFPWIGATSLATDVAQKINATLSGNSSALRYYLEYSDPSGNWITYDQQPFQPFDSASESTKIVNTALGYNTLDALHLQTIVDNPWGGGGRADPRTSRWGFGNNQYMNFIPAVTTGSSADTSTPTGADTVVWASYYPDGTISYGDHIGGRKDFGFVGIGGNYTGGSLYGYRGFQYGYTSENSIRQTYQTDGESGALANLRYNLDPDGIPRRSAAGYVTDTLNGGSLGTSPSLPLTGLPMAENNTASRPTMLHRPFRSIAELGYVFRDTPWGSINFTFPESGDSALLDVFCINPTSNASGVVAGRVNLNTHQAPVIQAMISNTLRDKDDSSNPVMSGAMALDLGNQLVTRTSTTNAASNFGPLMSRADLVGTWIGPTTPALTTSSLSAAISAPGAPNPDNYYTGYSYDLGTAAVPSVNGTAAIALIPRQRNAVMRALADSGTTRTWNLLIDLVAQSGRFPPNTSSLTNFDVEGEKHYWLHVAIDRYTGKILDSQLEVVKE